LISSKVRVDNSPSGTAGAFGSAGIGGGLGGRGASTDGAGGGAVGGSGSTGGGVLTQACPRALTRNKNSSNARIGRPVVRCLFI